MAVIERVPKGEPCPRHREWREDCSRCAATRIPRTSPFTEEYRLKVRRTLPKLVRDRIPEIIAREGWHPKFRVVADDQLVLMLLDKLEEERTELVAAVSAYRNHRQFKDHGNPDAGLIHAIAEEAVDLIEVVQTIAGRLGVTRHELSQTQLTKRAKKGGFQGGIILEEV